MNASKCAILAISLVALLGASPAATKPASSAKEVMSRFQSAINARDKAAVDALVYWGAADAWSRGMTEAALGMFEAETITSARLAPLDNSSKTTFKAPSGVKYGPSIAPVYRIIVQYAHGPGVKVDEGSLTVGTKGGAWYLVAIAVVK
jgi:hypothetical protein